VLFKHGEFGIVLHQSNVEAFKIVVRNVFHDSLVGEAAKSSQKFSGVEGIKRYPLPCSR
jgi:hypothetical protein